MTEEPHQVHSNTLFLVSCGKSSVRDLSHSVVSAELSDQVGQYVASVHAVGAIVMLLGNPLVCVAQDRTRKIGQMRSVGCGSRRRCRSEKMRRNIYADRLSCELRDQACQVLSCKGQARVVEEIQIASVRASRTSSASRASFR